MGNEEATGSITTPGPNAKGSSVAAVNTVFDDFNWGGSDDEYDDDVNLGLGGSGDIPLSDSDSELLIFSDNIPPDMLDGFEIFGSDQKGTENRNFY